MEVVISIAVVFVICLVFIGINIAKFISFKGQLMNEFGKYGVTFEAADQYYYRHRDKIHALNKLGVPINQIVEKHAGNILGRSATRGINKIEVQYSNSISAYEEEKHKKLIELLADKISFQIGPSGLSKQAEIRRKLLQNKYALGYMFGFTRAGLKDWGLFEENEEKSVETFKLVCISLFGVHSRELILKASEVKRNQQFSDGCAVGGQEFLDWGSSEDKDRQMPDSLRRSLSE